MQSGSFQFRPLGGTSTAFGSSSASSALDPLPAHLLEEEPSSAATPVTLAAYAESWLASVRGAVRPRTFDSYTAQLRLHVLPRLGHRPLGELTVDDVLGLIDQLRESGYTGWSIRTSLTPF